MHPTWKSLTQINHLDELVEISNHRPVIIFKHSTRCSLSEMAFDRLKNDWEHLSDEMDLFYLDLLEHRSLSNEIESRFMVRHESPQILIMSQGEIIGHTSHREVGTDFIKSALLSSEKI